MRDAPWTDDEMLTALHLMDDEGLTAEQVGRRVGRPRNSVLGIRHRVKTDYEASFAGDPDPHRHDATESWGWVRAGLDVPGRVPR